MNECLLAWSIYIDRPRPLVDIDFRFASSPLPSTLAMSKSEPEQSLPGPGDSEQRAPEATDAGPAYSTAMKSGWAKEQPEGTRRKDVETSDAAPTQSTADKYRDNMKSYGHTAAKKLKENAVGLAVLGMTAAGYIQLPDRIEDAVSTVMTALNTNPPDNIPNTRLWTCRDGSIGVNESLSENFPDGAVVCCPAKLRIKVPCQDDDDGSNNSTAPGADGVNTNVWDANSSSTTYAAASTFSNVGGSDLQAPYPTNCTAVPPEVDLTNLLDAIKDVCDICGDD